MIGYGFAAAVKSFRNRKRRPRRRWRGMVSIDGGLGALTETLGRRLGSDLMTDCRVLRMERTGEGHEITFLDPDGKTKTIRCRRLLLALSAAGAGRLLKPTLPEAGSILGSIDSGSMVVLNLGFRRGDVDHPLDGFGFLVPQNEPAFPLMGVLWADSVFPHHAPEDHRLIRVFVGGPRNPTAPARSDDELVAAAMGPLRELLGVTADPCLIDVCRHRATIPQYHQGHGEKIARLRAVVECVPGLHLIGNYLEGVSLNDCVRLSARVANELLSGVGERCEEEPRHHPVLEGKTAVA